MHFFYQKVHCFWHTIVRLCKKCVSVLKPRMARALRRQQMAAVAAEAAAVAAGGCDHVANFSRFACRMRYLSHVHKIASPDRKIVFFQTHSFEKFLLLVLYAVALRQ